MALFDILIYAAIAVFLFMRLWSVLGQKNEADEEAQSKLTKNKDAEDNVLVFEGGARPAIANALTAAGHAPTSLAGSIDQIKGKDPAFDEKKFVEGASLAFQSIVGAFTNGDLAPVAWLLGAAVSVPFEQSIQDVKSRGLVRENHIERIVAADIVKAELDGQLATLTVEFISYQINCLRNQEGQVVEGDPQRAQEIRDLWVFRRNLLSANPNWQLVETRS